MNVNKIVSAAFAHAAAVAPDYLASCFRTRSVDRTGSWYEGHSPDSLRATLLAAKWVEYPHPELKSPAVGFRCEVGGKLGMLPIAALPNEAEIILLDPKGGEDYWSGTRSVGATLSASRYGIEALTVSHTTLILGPSSRSPGAPLTVWTFHPGDPVNPSHVFQDRIDPDGRDSHGRQITVAEALSQGFLFAKLTA
jgi:hypothetical protein